jgi:hypothetical protein
LRSIDPNSHNRLAIAVAGEPVRPVKFFEIKILIFKSRLYKILHAVNAIEIQQLSCNQDFAETGGEGGTPANAAWFPQQWVQQKKSLKKSGDERRLSVALGADYTRPTNHASKFFSQSMPGRVLPRCICRAPALARNRRHDSHSRSRAALHSRWRLLPRSSSRIRDRIR